VFFVDDATGEAAIHVRDAAGVARVRIVVGLEPEYKPVLDVRGADGRPLIEIGEGDEIAAINLYDPDQMKRLSVAAGRDGAALTMTGTGSQGIQLFSGHIGNLLRVFRDECSVELSTPSSGSGVIKVHSESGVTWEAPRD
jgi:hypothetical protein